MEKSEDPEDIEYHLEELRSRFRIVFVSFVIASVIGFKLSSGILNFIQSDLALSLNTFTPFEALYTQIMIALFTGLIMSMPIIFYEALKFAEPGLKNHEYRALRNYLPVAFLLFSIGSIFTYEYIIFSALEFFKAFNSSAQLEAVWGLNSTIMFILRLSIVSGLLFQLPIVAALLGKIGLIDSQMMKEYRNYFIVGVLLLSALATPPDILTQVMIVLPVLLLYELSVVIVRRIE